MRISKAAFDLIVSNEVSSKAHYEAKLKRTEWPGAASGVTVGIGYDLGQTDRAKIEHDWRGRVPDPMLASMLSASGITGDAAKPLAARLKGSIEIPWDVALAVHRECVVPRWEAAVEKALPNADKLSPDSFGALVSLTFNRGASFGKEGERYREMRAIRAHMAGGTFDRIPAEIRAMKRIWRDKGLQGLLGRRDAEADLFDRGLSGLVQPDGGGAPSGSTAGDGVSEQKGTGAGLLRRAQQHVGEKYVNILVPKDNPNWKGPWDCAEFVSWLVYQEAGILYGCVDNNAKPSEAEAYTGGWQTDVERRGIRVSVEKAAATVGGIVLRYPPPGGMGHIALCDGKGGTVEAMSSKYGVVASTVHGRTWHTGVLIPGIKYDGVADTMPVRPPAELYARDAPNMDIAIVKRIQEALESKGFSPGTIDGEYGPDTEAAVVAFQLSEGLVADGEVGRDTAAALGISLVGTKPADTAPPPVGTGKPTLLGPTPFPGRPSVPGPTPAPVGSDLAHLVIAAMERKGYQVDRGPGEVNIVYVEGMNLDGTPNDDEANKWNDLRLVIKFEGGEPRIVGSWAATTEPGRYWTQNPMNPLGAARIEFGQYKAWQVGMHRNNHESLVQTGGQVTVCRDLNKDGQRTGDTHDTGEFGINQHWGYNNREVDKASAGCLVGQSVDGHHRFMAIVKSDPRYLANRKHVFATAILPESDVLTNSTLEAIVPLPAELPPGSVDGSDAVRSLQKLLGFSEEEQDGIFGEITMEAVKSFQRRRGLTVTGNADEKTRELLEREAAAIGGMPPVEPAPLPSEPPVAVVPPARERPAVGTRPAEPAIRPIIRAVIPKIPNLLLGVGTMNPFIALAGAVLPDILKAVVGDKAGSVAGAVKKAVTEVTRTENPEEAQQKLETDPAAVAALQLKLAEIAADQEEKRQQAQLALLKEQNEQEVKKREAQLALLKEQNEQDAKKREAQLAQFRAEIEDTKGARSTFAALALANNPMAWGAPVVSLLVTVGFFGILTLLIFGVGGDLTSNQIINITVGALAAAFATVVSFWLGSSQGSRTKDSATIQLQAEQVSTQVRQAEVFTTTMQAQAKQAEALQATMKTAIAGAPAIGKPKPSNFPRCLDIVLGYEGGYSEEPGDPSGATQFGVTIGALRDFRQDTSLGVEDLKKLGRDEACEIYRTRYWNVLRCDDLPNGVDLVVFDFAVDSNAGRAARALQQVVGAEADGSIGDATLAATKVKPARDVIKGMSDRRLEYYRSLPDAANFIKGAMSRTNAVEKAAMDMIAAERPAAP